MSMTYTRLGNSGLIVSRLCFGTMTFNAGTQWIPGVGKVDQKPANEMVAQAMDAGVNFFDTADVYSSGDSETILGQALGSRRNEAIVCTKLGFRQSDNILDAGLNRGHIMNQIEVSLNRLGTDYLDLLVLHKTDFSTPMEETLSALQTAVEQGKLRYIGVSNWPAWQAARAIQYQRDNRMHPFICGQYLYNAVSRDVEQSELPMLAELGGSLMAWSPLAGGLLSGKYDPENLEGTDGRLADGDFLDTPVGTAQVAIKELTSIASAHGVHMATVSLAWILQKNRTHTAIFGASKKPHVDAALAATSLELSPEEMARIDSIAPAPKRYPNWADTMMADEQTIKALS